MQKKTIDPNATRFKGRKPTGRPNSPNEPRGRNFIAWGALATTSVSRENEGSRKGRTYGRQIPGAKDSGKAEYLIGGVKQQTSNSEGRD